MAAIQSVTAARSNYAANNTNTNTVNTASASSAVENAPAKDAVVIEQVSTPTNVANNKNQQVNIADADGSVTSDQELSNEYIRKAVADLNRKMKNTSCQFGIHEATNRVTIKLVDNDTSEVIREYPAEETLEMIAKAWELAGILVDKKL